MRTPYQSILTPYCRGAAVTKVSQDALGASELAYLAVGELPLLKVVLDVSGGYDGHRGWKWKTAEEVWT